MAKCRECGEVFGPFDGKDGVCNKCLGIPMEDNSCIIETNNTPENKKNESSNFSSSSFDQKRRSRKKSSANY